MTTTQPADDQLMTPKQVESEYGFNALTLANWRSMGRGPDYIKTRPSNAGRIKYRRSAIEEWPTENSYHASSDYQSRTPEGRLESVRRAYQRWNNDELTDEEMREAIGQILYPNA
jgi:hypothetical protein